MESNPPSVNHCIRLSAAGCRSAAYEQPMKNGERGLMENCGKRHSRGGSQIRVDFAKVDSLIEFLPLRLAPLPHLDSFMDE